MSIEPRIDLSIARMRAGGATVNDRDVSSNADHSWRVAGELDDGLRFFQGEWHVSDPFHSSQSVG